MFTGLLFFFLVHALCDSKVLIIMTIYSTFQKLRYKSAIAKAEMKSGDGVGCSWINQAKIIGFIELSGELSELW